MRVQWQDRALEDLEGVAQRAPRQARRIHTAVGQLADSEFPGRCRTLPNGTHVLSVPPHGVIHQIVGDEFRVIAIEDARRATTTFTVR